MKAHFFQQESNREQEAVHQAAVCNILSNHLAIHEGNALTSTLSAKDKHYRQLKKKPECQSICFPFHQHQETALYDFHALYRPFYEF